MSFGISASVSIVENDQSDIIPLAFGTNAGIAMTTTWGPAGVAQLVTTEPSLVTRFGRPNSTATGTDYLLAISYLAYSTNLYVSRVVDLTTSLNAAAAKVGSSPTAVLIKNDIDAQTVTFPVSDHIVARYAGDYGNSLQVIVVSTAAQYNHASFDSYRPLFTGAPGTSTYADNNGSADDELHLVVIDNLGKFTGIPGQVLEYYSFLSKAFDAKGENGASIYYKDWINVNSSYIYIANPDNTAGGLGVEAGSTVAVAGVAFTASTATSPVVYTLSLGADGTLDDSDIQDAFTVFADPNTTDISLVIGGTASSAVSQFIVQSVAEVRKDCVAFVSPPQNLVVNQTNFDTVATAVANYSTTTLNLNSSYGVLDSGWKMMYDKYNNIYRWIPLNADIAGVCARTDRERDPWWSPGGLNRGQIKNVVRLAWSPTEAQRDVLYPASVNPVVSLIGRGTVLFGDKTLLRKPSAFDRINVRRLFIVLEKIIANAAQYQLFEFNDEFTRSRFVALVEPVLRDVQGRRGLQDFRVVCDETNNTPQVIASNQFKANILIRPNYSINYIQLSFTAVGGDVSFEEVVKQGN